MPPLSVDSHNNVQPKVESLEFLEDAVPTHIQQAQHQALAKQNVTYMNIENFTTATTTDKNNATTSVATSTPSNQHHVVTSRKLLIFTTFKSLINHLFR